jgi:hypothetical protein
MKRANLDTALTAFTAGGNLLRPLDGVIQVFAVEDVIAGELLFRLGERPIQEYRLTVI